MVILNFFPSHLPCATVHKFKIFEFIKSHHSSSWALPYLKPSCGLLNLFITDLLVLGLCPWDLSPLWYQHDLCKNRQTKKNRSIFPLKSFNTRINTAQGPKSLASCKSSPYHLGPVNTSSISSCLYLTNIPCSKIKNQVAAIRCSRWNSHDFE